MPSPRHDALNRLVHDHPEPPLPDRNSRELHANTVVVGGPPQNRRFSVIVEVESKISEEKLRQTVVAAAALWLETRKPVHVIFITPDPDAAKLAGPVEVRDGCLTVTMHPVIAGPDHIPVLTDPVQMAGDLLASALSVMAHGDRPEVAKAFVKLLDDLPADDATSLFSYASDMATPRARLCLEETVTTYIPEHSPWAQNLYRKGQAAGREEGEAKGCAKGEASAVLSVLRLRGIEVPPGRHRQISTCTDLALLDVWLRRALDAEHIDDLFDDPARPEARS